MEFPIAGVVINPLYLAAIGFVVGVLGGFFGVGGGFIAGPMMFLSGVPMNFVVGTDLAHMTGKSIVAARRHSILGHVDFKLGVLMIIGTIIGVEIGAQVVEAIKEIGKADQIIGWAYVAILVAIGSFTAIESIRAIRMIHTDKMEAKEAVGFTGLTKRIQLIRLKPMISLPASGIASISLWVIIISGLISGTLAGFLGVGGGFIRMPLMVYVLGIPTHVAIGTDLFEIIFSAGFGTITHAIKGNVDIMIALIMQTGAAIGAQIGSVATHHFSGPRIRLLFSGMPFIGAILVIWRLLDSSAGAIH